MAVPMPDWFYQHEVRVRVYEAGAGGNDGHGAPSRMRAFVEDEQRTVLDAEGSEVTSNTQVHVGFDEVVPLGSLVTVWAGLTGEREARVLAIARHENGPLPSYQTLSLE